MRRNWGKKRLRVEVDPDEILIDTQNLSELDVDRFEGRLERPLSRRSMGIAAAVLLLGGVVLLGRAGGLQILDGVAYAKQAEDNQLAEQIIFADRGIISDRAGRPLAWNSRPSATSTEFAERVYAQYRGIGHVLGYVKPPAKDSSGYYYRNEYVGLDGAELAYDATLKGVNGVTLTETDARGKVVSSSATQAPQNGAPLTLSIDAGVSQMLYDSLARHAQDAGATGAAGVIIDVRTGELLALVSYPEYSPETVVAGEKTAIAAYNSDKRLPFLNRATDGLYAPGSIVKPVVAAAALQEGVITPQTQIVSTGQISVPNPYDPEHPSIFKDWRVNGLMTVRDAIAVSSDVFFYEVGGGFQSQAGLGIARLDQYFKRFGIGQDAGLAGFSEKAGTIPSPEWKAATFPQDPTWRIGDTYHTAIGQYGTQLTPLQAARMIAVVANGGRLMTPTLVASSSPQGSDVGVDPADLAISREGMRQGVTQGIATAVNFPFVHVAAKTGTAQVGLHNEAQNAWMVGFWPYESPHYAFAVVLEHMPAGTPIGGSIVMSDFLTALNAGAPQYLQ